ncbi:MAG: DUF4097 family beta strand repeat-containing protein [Gemmatimonadota bacterium]|nr:DUF4097 family beta strand repeat-containing protein [Gemmatimonadota bacterium]
MIQRAVQTVAIAAAMVVCGTTANLAAQQDFSWSGSVDRGDAVSIRGINGGIVARAGSGSEVRVTAVKTSEDDPISSVRVEVVEDGDGVLICAVYPTPDNADEENRCARGRAYKMNNKDNDVKVNFTVEVPAGVELNAVTVNGDVEVSGLTGDVNAVTVNGDVDVSTNGSATATTVNGSIEARVGRLDDDLEFTTVNGGVRLTLPAGASADVEATTVNGRIETDFPITIRGRWGPRSARGEIGGGGVSLHITTVNGSIEIIRA